LKYYISDTHLLPTPRLGTGLHAGPPAVILRQYPSILCPARQFHSFKENSAQQSTHTWYDHKN